MWAKEQAAPEKLLPVKASRLAQSDPWFISYLTALGDWADVLPPDLIRFSRLRETVTRDELVKFEVDAVVEPGIADLIGRLRDSDALSPCRASLVGLGSGGPRRLGFRGAEPDFPEKFDASHAAGGNILVIYEPGSVEDLCLAWNLRAIHGQQARLPLAIPVTADIPLEVGALTTSEAFALSLTNLFGAVTSLSVDDASLEALVDELGEHWFVARPEKLLEPVSPPARESADVAHFTDGAAEIAAWASTDRAGLPADLGIGDALGTVTRLRLQDGAIPPYKALRGGLRAPALRLGWFEANSGSPHETVRMRWPTGWTVVEAAAREHGLRARRSSAGAAAELFIRRIGGIHELGALADPKLMPVLRDLAETGGTAWLKKQLRRQHAADSEEEIAERAAALSAGSTPNIGATHSVDFNRFREVLADRAVTDAWIGWCEERAILRRGAETKCTRCRRVSWTSVALLQPPISCHHCGSVNARPFAGPNLAWKFQAGEALHQVAAVDAFSHLFSLRWIMQVLFHHGMYGSLYGGHPGVEFVRPNGEVLGEADVVLIFNDGSIVVGECKERSAGLMESDLTKLDRIADAVDSPWTFIATTSGAADCGELWMSAIQSGPGRPRHALTAEHLFGSSQFAINDEPFRWRDPVDDDSVLRSAAVHFSRHAETRNDADIRSAWPD